MFHCLMVDKAMSHSIKVLAPVQVFSSCQKPRKDGNMPHNLILVAGKEDTNNPQKFRWSPCVYQEVGQLEKYV